MSKTLAKKLGISVLSDLTIFRPAMFPVGGTRRYDGIRKMQFSYVKRVPTFNGNFVVSWGY